MKKKEINKQSKIDRDAYRKFIEQVEIEDIRLILANIKLLDYEYRPTDAEVSTRCKVEFNEKEKGFCYIHHFHLTIKDRKSRENKAKIFLAFRIEYASKIPMNDQFNEIFTERNLFVNTWPYFREFANNITARFGWPPYIAPVYQA